MKYIRLCERLNDFGTLVPEADLESHLKSNDQEYYTSIYHYGEEEYKHFKDTGTVRGITGLKTDKLVWDFDDEANPENAKVDTQSLIKRLKEYGVTNDQIELCFSGNKGFSVTLKTTSELTKPEFKTIASKLSEGLKTRDTKIFNDNRIFRVPLTRHPTTGLYKIALEVEDLECSMAQIKERAQSVSNSIEITRNEVILPEAILALKTAKLQYDKVDFMMPVGPDMTKKPKNVPNCLWILTKGHIKPGNKHSAIMALASYWKSLGYDAPLVHRMIKGVMELQHKIFPNDDEVSKEDVWARVQEVFGPNWRGGIYTCKEHQFLREVCEGAGHPCDLSDEDKNPVLNVDDVSAMFTNFAVNLDKNIIKTGLKELDDRVMLMTSSSIGLLGAPGSGKTTLAMNILANACKMGVESLFCSLDMGYPMVFSKMASNVTDLPAKEVIRIFKEEPENRPLILAKIKEKFGNFPTLFRSGQSVEDIKKMILDQERRRGKKIKLVIVDYLELISGPYGDDTANSSIISKQLKDLSTDLEICLIVLVQPQKSAGDASAPLLSMRKIKGSSSLEQNFRTIISVYREGFNPKEFQKDRYMTIACLKNTLDSLFTIDYRWNGLRGEVSELSKDEKNDLELLRSEIKDKAQNNVGGSGGDGF